ncbi:DUF1353 domain-containing protein [Vibrio makurazakiensis]
MPILQPLPIPTKKVPSLICRIYIWIFSIREWEVKEEWSYKLPNGVIIVIPKGFVFDGASIPRPLWMLLSPTGLLLIPGLIHDYAYRYDKLVCRDEQGNLIDYQKGAGKAHWDKLFRDVGIEVNGIAFIDVLAWLALFIGGWFTWRKHRKNDKKEA